MFALLDRVPAVPSNEGITPTERAAGDVEFRDVWFQYEGRDKVSHDTTSEVRTSMCKAFFAFYACAFTSSLRRRNREGTPPGLAPNDAIAVISS